MALKVNTEIIKVSDGHLDHPENQGVIRGVRGETQHLSSLDLTAGNCLPTYR